MSDYLEDSFVGEVVLDKIRERIPAWFDEYESGLLIDTLENGTMDEELEEIVSSIEAKVLPEVKARVDRIFGPASIKWGGEEDLEAKAIDLLKNTVAELKADMKRDIEDTQEKIKRLRRQMKEVEAELRVMQTTGSLKNTRRRK